jgi:hypothetical protein
LQAARSAPSLASPTPGQPSPPASPATRRDSPAVRVNYAPIFHPGVTDIGAAAPIALGVSEERAGVDVTIQLVPAGPQTEMPAGAGLRALSAIPRPDGTYVFTGVAAGAYTIKAIIGRGRGAAPNTSTQWAAADVTVSGQDLDVPLTLQPGVAVNGRVVFEGSEPTAAEVQSLSFMLVPPGSGGQIQTSGVSRRASTSSRRSRTWRRASGTIPRCSRSSCDRRPRSRCGRARRRRRISGLGATSQSRDECALAIERHEAHPPSGGKIAGPANFRDVGAASGRVSTTLRPLRRSGSRGNRNRRA